MMIAVLVLALVVATEAAVRPNLFFNQWPLTSPISPIRFIEPGYDNIRQMLEDRGVHKIGRIIAAYHIPSLSWSNIQEPNWAVYQPLFSNKICVAFYIKEVYPNKKKALHNTTDEKLEPANVSCNENLGYPLGTTGEFNKADHSKEFEKPNKLEKNTKPDEVQETKHAKSVRSSRR